MYGKPLPIVDAFGAPAASAHAASATHTKSASFEYLTTRKDELVGWARKFSLFPYPFVTACCAKRNPTWPSRFQKPRTRMPMKWRAAANCIWRF